MLVTRAADSHGESNRASWMTAVNGRPIGPGADQTIAAVDVGQGRCGPPSTATTIAAMTEPRTGVHMNATPACASSDRATATMLMTPSRPIAICPNRSMSVGPDAEQHQRRHPDQEQADRPEYDGLPCRQRYLDGHQCVPPGPAEAQRPW